jgi:hypothetical protein
VRREGAAGPRGGRTLTLRKKNEGRGRRERRGNALPPSSSPALPPSSSPGSSIPRCGWSARTGGARPGTPGAGRPPPRCPSAGWPAAGRWRTRQVGATAFLVWFWRRRAGGARARARACVARRDR